MPTLEYLAERDIWRARAEAAEAERDDLRSILADRVVELEAEFQRETEHTKRLLGELAEMRARAEKAEQFKKEVILDGATAGALAAAQTDLVCAGILIFRLRADRDRLRAALRDMWLNDLEKDPDDILACHGIDPAELGDPEELKP